MRTRLRILATLVTAASSVVALAAGGSPATADNGVKTVKLEIPKDATLVAYLVTDGSGKPMRNFSVHTETTSSKQYAVVDGVGTQAILCTAWNSPAPTYSSSNHTMHYGVQGSCNTPIPLRARTSLWSGPTDESTNTWQDETGWDYGTGTIYSGDVSACIDWGGFAWWELLMYVQGDTNYDGYWEQFYPYPGHSLKENECMDIA
jgi:hypothetical protein